MTEGVTVEVVGVDALARDLGRLAAAGGPFDQATAEAARRILEPKAATLRTVVPHDSGAMAGSVNVKPLPLGAVLSEGDGIVYAGWVDFGGSRPQSGPRDYRPEGRYLFPTVGDLGPTATTAIGDGLQRAIDSYGWTYQGSP